MDFLNKMMGDMDFSKFAPPQKEVVAYKIISEFSLDSFNSESKRLIELGYEPIGFLSTLVTTTLSSVLYVKEFIKYKKTE